MIIQCPNCQSKYRLREEKISGPEVKVQCQKCREVIVVQRPSPEPGSLASAPGLLDVMSPSPSEEPKIDEKAFSPMKAGQDLLQHQLYADPSALSAETVSASQEVMNDNKTQAAEESGDDLAEEERPSIFNIPSAEDGISIFEDSLTGFGLENEMAIEAPQETQIIEEQHGGMGLMEEFNHIREQQERPGASDSSVPSSNEASTGFAEDALEEALEDSIEDSFDDLPDEEEEQEKYELNIKEKPAKSSTLKITLRLLLVLFCFASLGYVVFQEGTAKLEGFISKYVLSQGNEEIEVAPSQAFSINNLQGYYFQRREQTSRMFVVSGDVKNQTASAKNFIQLKGRIFGSFERLIAEKKVYSGNTLSEKELAIFSKEEIEAQLQTKMGRALVNFNIQAGSQVSFMIVFFDVPGNEDVVNFEVEVTAWQKGAE